MDIKTLILCFIIIIFGVNAQTDTPESTQRAHYKFSEPLPVSYLTDNLISDKVSFHFKNEIISFDSNFIDFERLDLNPQDYYTCYLVNNTDSTFIVGSQDGSLIMIQEALDDNGNWNPIEHWEYSGCGNSYMNPLKLKSGKCVFIPIKKYQGNIKTKLRLKLVIRKQVMYSTSFNGWVYKSQFKKKSSRNRDILYPGDADYLDGDFLIEEIFLDRYFVE